MKTKRHSFARRITWRIMIILLVTNVLTILAVLFFVFFGMAAQSIEHYASSISNVEEKMETQLNAVEVLAINNVAEIEKHLKKTEDVLQALHDELLMNSAVMGCFAAFEPDYYPQYGRWFEPYAVKRDNSRIERMLVGSDTHDYLNKEWYKKGLNTPEGYWSDPYFDGDGAGAMLCSYVRPIRDESGKAVGIYGADLPLDWLVSRMKEVDEKENNYMNEFEKGFRQADDLSRTVYSFIIDRRGNFIVHPDTAKVLKQNIRDLVKSTPNENDDVLCNSMLNGEKGHQIVTLNDKRVFVYYAKLSHTGWSMAIVVPMFTMFQWGIATTVIVLVLMVTSMIVIFIVSLISIHRATKPLKYLSKTANEIAKGHFDTPLPVFEHNDEITMLRNTFETMQHSIASYINELRLSTASKASMESELRIAHNIQMSMLPKTFPPFPERDDIDVFGLLNPAKAVGGDFYDFFIRDEKLFFTIGDVSGKGIPASLVMAVTRSLFRNIANHTAEPEQILTTLNEAMSKQNETNMFVTAFVGVLDLPTGRLRYSNAGHDIPLVIRPDGSKELLPCDANLPIGVIPNWKYTIQHSQITTDSMIFIYTDGLTEAENSKHELFGMNRVIETLSHGFAHPQYLITHMTKAVHKFVGNAEQSDDLTMLAIHYTRRQLNMIMHRQLVMNNDVQEIPRLSSFVDEVCEELGMDMSTTMQMNLALEEAVVNVMNYAYPKDFQGEVRVEAGANAVRLKFIITDDGKPFDPTARGEVDTTLSAEERNIGGLGIHLVRRIMDSINYERINGQNVLTLRKNFKKEES